MRILHWITATALGMSAAGMCPTASAGETAGETQIPPAGTIRHDAASLRWVEAPPSMPPGTQIAVLEGDPGTGGLFTLRVRVPAGARVPPHWHPRDERVTVLSGRIGVGFGRQFDEKLLRDFEAGSYYVNPAAAAHFLFFPVETIVQITGEGPWVVNVLDSGASQ